MIGSHMRFGSPHCHQEGIQRRRANAPFTNSTADPLHPARTRTEGEAADHRLTDVPPSGQGCVARNPSLTSSPRSPPPPSSPFTAGYTTECAHAAFAMPTDDPVLISKAANDALRHRLRLVALIRADVPTPHDHHGVGDLLDRIQHRHGEKAIRLGIAGLHLGPRFEMRRGMLSPSATTRWAEFATVSPSCHFPRPAAPPLKCPTWNECHV